MVGHNEWAEQVLEGFSWGHAFFEVNGSLLDKYAQCRNAVEVAQVQENWLSSLEKEWVDSRKTEEGEDEWAGGNPNHMASLEDADSAEEDEDEEEEEEEKEETTDEDEKESKARTDENG